MMPHPVRHFNLMHAEDREAEVQRKIVTLLRKLGFKVYVLSQGRRTRQTPGVCDFIAKHGARGLSFTQETKTEDGRLSDDQQEFADLCRQCGDHHVIGGYEATVTFLQEQRFIAEGYTP